MFSLPRVNNSADGYPSIVLLRCHCLRLVHVALHPHHPSSLVPALNANGCVVAEDEACPDSAQNIRTPRVRFYLTSHAKAVCLIRLNRRHSRVYEPPGRPTPASVLLLVRLYWGYMRLALRVLINHIYRTAGYDDKGVPVFAGLHRSGIRRTMLQRTIGAATSEFKQACRLPYVLDPICLAGAAVAGQTSPALASIHCPVLSVLSIADR